MLVLSGGITASLACSSSHLVQLETRQATPGVDAEAYDTLCTVLLSRPLTHNGASLLVTAHMDQFRSDTLTLQVRPIKTVVSC